MNKKKQYYIKYPLDYGLLFNILQTMNKQKINFFIDFNSICKGFYKAETVLYEISEYMENSELSGQLLIELKEWLNNLYMKFKSFDPYFVIFYDDGICLQNKLIMPTYKSGRSVNTLVIDENQKSTEIFRKIRKLYYKQIKEQFEKEDISSVFYISEYETDLVPHYCIVNNYFDSNDSKVLNVILSMDKDLLQTVEFNNTICCPTGFKEDKKLGKYVIDFKVYDRSNAISYIYNKFSPGILTAKYIPLILSLCGDRSDEIAGITGIGPAKAIKLIEKNSVPHSLNKLELEINNLPQILQENINTIIRNYKLISFDEQIKRLPRNFLELI